MKLQVGFVLLNVALFYFLDYLSFLTVIFSAVFFLHLRSVLLLNLLSYAQHKPMCLCIFGYLINYLFTIGECLKERVAFFPFLAGF